MKVSIIIISWNTHRLLQQCLKSIHDQGISDSEIIIVDNASTDGTREYLGSLNGPIQIITNTENKGFTLACNQGAQIARGEYVLLLNNDTHPELGWLDNMLELAESDPAIGIV